MKKKSMVSALVLVFVLLTGCGADAKRDKARVTVNEYEKIVYEFVKVERGDIEPVLSLKLNADSFETKSYFPVQDNMEVEQVYIKKGDIVESGDVLVSFKSGDIEEQLGEYENKLEELRLLIEHYTQLQQIDSSVDYSNDIRLLEEDMDVASLYIQELNAKLDMYSIKAEGTGVVNSVSGIVDNYGVVNSTDIVATVIYGTGDYLSTTTDDYDFQIGDKYTATYGAVASYELELVSVEEDGKDVNGNTVRKLKFHIISEGTGVSEVERLNVLIHKPVLKDVLYVPEDSVFDVDDKFYVYTLDEDGFRHAAEVKLGSTVDGFTVIESGLSEGDRVVIR